MTINVTCNLPQVTKSQIKVPYYIKVDTEICWSQDG